MSYNSLKSYEEYDGAFIEENELRKTFEFDDSHCNFVEKLMVDVNKKIENSRNTILGWHINKIAKQEMSERLFSDGADNTLQTQPIADRIFVIRAENGLVVKRSGGLNGPELTLISDNPVIGKRVVNLSTGDVAVIGRVVWYGRSV